MESKNPTRFTLGKHSSLSPERHREEDELHDDVDANIYPGDRLMYLANECDVDGIREVLQSGTGVDFKDIDGRTALHVAACQGSTHVVDLLLKYGADVDPKDRWGNTVIHFITLFSLVSNF